jgi:hypothetical protein
MKREGKSSVAGLLLGLIFFIFISGVVYILSSNAFERDVPKITLEKEIEWNLKEPLKIHVTDESGIRFVEASLFDGEKHAILETKALKETQQSVDLNLTFPKVGLNPNQKVFELSIKAVDKSKWNFFSGNSVEAKAVIKVDTKRPEINIVSNSYKITKGGAATVIFRAYDESMKSLYIETSFGKKFYPTPFYKEGIIFRLLHGQRPLIILVLLLLLWIEQAM